MCFQTWWHFSHFLVTLLPICMTFRIATFRKAPTFWWSNLACHILTWCAWWSKRSVTVFVFDGVSCQFQYIICLYWCLAVMIACAYCCLGYLSLLVSLCHGCLSLLLSVTVACPYCCLTVVLLSGLLVIIGVPLSWLPVLIAVWLSWLPVYCYYMLVMGAPHDISGCNICVLVSTKWRIAIEVNVSRPAHVLHRGVSKGLLPVKRLSPSQFPLLVLKLHKANTTATKLTGIQPTSPGDITGLMMTRSLPIAITGLKMTRSLPIAITAVYLRWHGLSILPLPDLRWHGLSLLPSSLCT